MSDDDSGVDRQVWTAIEGWLRHHSSIQSSDLATLLGVSRQSASTYLSKLSGRGHLERVGRGRATRYSVPTRTVERRYRTEGLEEDAVWQELSASLPVFATFSSVARSVFAYAVTELVNNAIDHSGADEVSVRATSAGPVVIVEVEDAGAGVFRTVRESLSLRTNLEALQELSKGKTTTAPAGHTGEGIFFVSKAGDRFVLESDDLRWIVDNRIQDMAVGQLSPPRSGTLARFEARPSHVQSLRSLFDAYTDEYRFNRTRTTVKLFAIGTEFVSRSQAKRLVHGLEKFEIVVLDFKGVTTVGQGFADEVFRVWAKAHPEVQLVCENMIEPVEFMVGRAGQHGDVAS